MLDPVRHRLQLLAEPHEVVTPLLRLAHPDTSPSGPAWPPPLQAGILEPRQGYRFRPENLTLPDLLLAHFGPLPSQASHPPPGYRPRPTRLLELGAGTGSLLLLASYLLCPERALGIERQLEQVSRLKRTLEAHAQPGWSCLEGDLRDPQVLDQALGYLEAKPALVLANPPFFPPDWGIPSAQASTHQSTHALAGGMEAFLATCAQLLSPDGLAIFLYDASRLAEALAAVAASGLAVNRLDFVPDARPGKANLPYRVWLSLSWPGWNVGWIR